MSAAPLDRAASAGAILVFSAALAMLNLALPLLAFRAGYSIAAIGALTAVSGVAHLVVRFAVPGLSRLVSDRVLITVAAAALAGACALPLLSLDVVTLGFVQVLQGCARGLFWTASQLHAVRRGGGAVRPMATVNLLASVGTVAGPVLAGLVAQTSLEVALVCAAALALAPTALVPAMERHPVLATRPPGTTGMWSNSVVRTACWISAAAGVWAALSVSYVPVILEAAGHSTATVGVVVGIGNAGTVLGSAIIAGFPLRVPAFWVRVAGLVNATGVIIVTPLSEWVVAVTLTVFVAGTAAGALLALGPGLAAEAVKEDQLAGVVAMVGGFRAAALFVAPLAVSAAVIVVSLPVALAAFGVLTGITSGREWGHSGTPPHA